MTYLIKPFFLNLSIVLSKDISPSILVAVVFSLPSLKNIVVGVPPSKLNLSLNSL